MFYAYGGLTSHPSNCATWKIIGYDEYNNAVKSTGAWACNAKTYQETQIFATANVGVRAKSRLVAYDAGGKVVLSLDSPLLS